MKVIISGGGTGGHIFPAITIADEIKTRIPTADILFVGAEGKMEMERVPKAGYPIVGLPIRGLQRKLTWQNLTFVWRVLKSLWRARKVLKEFKPACAVGVGGYASGPLLYVASRMKIPTLIQEQNSYAGITNKILAKSVDKICVAYGGMDTVFPKQKIIFTGNPVRESLQAVDTLKNEALKYFQWSPNKKTLLIIGGSLGARTINQAVSTHLQELVAIEDIAIFWQVGKIYWEQYQDMNLPKNVRMVPFIDRMDYAYALADVVLCRAGALTVSELCLVGRTAIFVPSPNVAEDHQTKNAQAIQKYEACEIIRDEDLENTIVEKIRIMMEDNDLRVRLAKNIKSLARPKATEKIVDEILKLSK